ncbi:hypothetical protein ATL42_2783 [Sanguibacter antarcticus]|uniref:Uncharacterized protein n=1 Tax=Sanguibacter antarcticus TaxID=372484 RepID=A0A2A9E972_9MICO|nr:hypothetical protein ATL42_2783 [Sanguibacter antarcticus]
MEGTDAPGYLKADGPDGAVFEADLEALGLTGCPLAPLAFWDYHQTNAVDADIATLTTAMEQAFEIVTELTPDALARELVEVGAVEVKR